MFPPIRARESPNPIFSLSLSSLFAMLILLFSNFRRYSQDNAFYYPPEKYFGHGPTPELPGWDSGDGEHAIPVHLFGKHVQELHLDQVSLPYSSLTSLETFKWI